MGQKNDQMLAHLAHRIGKLSRRNVALAKWAMEAEDRARLVKVQMQGEMVGLKARLEAELDSLKEQNAKLTPGAEVTVRAELDLGKLETDRDQLRAELERLETAQRNANRWPTQDEIDAAENGMDWAVGTEYVSPHLRGEWKLIELRASSAAVFCRVGHPDSPTPVIIVDLLASSALCFTEAPF